MGINSSVRSNPQEHQEVVLGIGVRAPSRRPGIYPPGSAAPQTARMAGNRSTPRADGVRARRRGEARASGGLRSFRADDATMRERVRLRLGVDPDRPPEADAALLRRLSRALRAERRAAQRGRGYDPLRHLLLARLVRRLAAPRRRPPA